MIIKRDDSPKDELASRPDGPGSLFSVGGRGGARRPDPWTMSVRETFLHVLSYIIFLLRLKFGKIKEVLI